MMCLAEVRELILEVARIKSDTGFCSGRENSHFVDNAKVSELRTDNKISLSAIFIRQRPLG